MIRILHYMKKHEDSLKVETDISQDLYLLFKKIKIHRIPYIDNAISELSNDKTDYFNISKKIENAKSKNNINVIVKSFLSKTNISYKDFEKTLNAYYSFSIFDTFLYYSSISRMCDFPHIYDNISLNLRNSFKTLSSIKVNKNFYSDSVEDHIELTYFRDSFLLMELEDFTFYKMIHGSIYNTNETKKEDRSIKVNNYLKDYFSNINTLKDLRVSKCELFDNDLKKYNKETCSFLENTTGLIYFLENNNCDIDECEEILFVKLMTFTRDIGSICPTSYLKKLYNDVSSIELKLVFACLLFSKTKLHSEEFALRKEIQQITNNNFGSSIREFFDKTYEISPSVAEYLVQICDVTFLSKLFNITDRPNKAIEDRCEILEWFGEKTEDTTYSQRAKNLRIDVQISKEKGIIDDSRIYVDPLRFTQWVTDNILDQLTVILESIDKSKERTIINVDWENVDSELSYDSQITSLLLKCYEEFCTNKFYGIASYLGRRIRHGTFKGTAMKDIEEIKNKLEYSLLFKDEDFKDHFNNWIKDYEDMLKDLRTSKLHVWSLEKEHGMIIPQINTESKKVIAKHLVIEIIKYFTNNKNNMGLAQIISEYCWRIVEEDLKNIINILTEKKSKKAVYSYRNINNERQFQIVAKHFSQELNAIMSENFRTIIQWFNKPSILSPSTSITLLFNVVVSQVKGEVADFTPEIDSPCKDVQISGGQYFSIYDALYILVYNVAEHSTTKDKLVFEIQHKIEEKTIELRIISFESTSSNLTKAKSNIIAKLEEDSVHNAHIIEGKSGIKKLRLMKYNNYINDIKYNFEQNKIEAILSIGLGY